MPRPCLGQLLDSGRDVEWIGVTDPALWKAVTLQVGTPGSQWPVEAGGGTVKSLVILPPASRAEGLLQHSLRKGLKGWGLQLMRKLVTYTGKSGSTSVEASASHTTRVESLTEAEAIRLLCRSILKEETDDVVEHVLAAREREPAGSTFVASALEEVDALCADLGSDDEPELHQDLADYRQTVERITARRDTSQLHRKHKQVKTSRTTSSSSQVPVDHIDWAGAPMGLEEARRLSPPECTIFKEQTYHQRWKISAPWLDQVHSCVFHGRKGLSENDALRSVLCKAWSAYSRKTGTPCPHQLDTPL
eukprot:2685093-Amphidinium_carterae.1